MNTNIILILEVVQCIWWIILSIIFQWNHYIVIIALSSISIVIKIGLVNELRKIKNQVQYLLLLLLILADTITYTEINLLLYKLFNPFSHHTNTLFIVTNQYIIKEIVSKQISYKILKFCYPCYIILRLFSIVFIQFDYTILESIIILLVFIFAISGDEKSIICAKIRLSLKLNEEEQSDRCVQILKQSNQHNSRQNGSSHLFFNDQFSRDKMISPSILSNKHQSSNDVLSIAKQKESIEIDKLESLQCICKSKILHVISEGIIILNKTQKLVFVNKQCLKLLQCDNEELILPKLKDCLRNQIINQTNHQPPQNTQNKRNNRKVEMTQQTLEDIIKTAQQNKVQLDIFDVLLNQAKYQHYHQGQHDGEKNGVDESQIQQNDQNQFSFNFSLESSKTLKLKINLTHMSNQFLDLIVSNDMQMFGDQINQPVLVLILKDNTYKNKFTRVEHKNQQLYHLLKKQLYKLRTPLNLNQLQLRTVGDVQKEEQEFVEQLDLIKCSTSILQYSVNNIVDFISFQLNEFTYFFSRFSINELITEIEQVFIPYIIQKKISFQIKIQSSLSEILLNSDKLRIIQVLLNVLNHQSNIIIQGGEINLTFLAQDEFTIQVIVENNIVQMNRKTQFSFDQTILKNQDNKIGNDIITNPELGFGLSLAQKLAKGFIDENNNNNNFEIQQNSVDGCSISFLIQNQALLKDQEQTRNKSNTGSFMFRNKSQSWSQEDNFIIKKYCYQDNTNHYEGSEKVIQKSEGIKSSDSPIIAEDLSEPKIIPQSTYFQFRSIESPKQLIQNKTFSFKVSTLQLHECNFTCKKILIVEDQIFNQIALKTTLNHFAIQCDQAYDGYQAIQKVKEKLQSTCQFYDIIFMDIELPGQNGFETSKEIIQMGCKKTAIVICSAYDTKDNLLQFELSGLCDYLQKPILQIELLQILKKYQLVK